jgi:hypothetical protein
LCAAAEDSTDSPDLGPPPVSRYVEEVAVKQSPPRAVGIEVPRSPSPPTSSSPVKLDYSRKPSGSPDRDAELDEMLVNQASPNKANPTKKTTPAPTTQQVRAGTKRKYGDENGIIHSATAAAGKENAIVAEKAFPARSGQKRKSLADLAGVPPSKAQSRVVSAAKRTPLAAKSTNEDVSSPRKGIKAAPLKEAKKEQVRSLNDSVMKEEAIRLEPAIQAVNPPAVDQLELESETAVPSVMPSSPTTPDRPAQKEVTHDTPPPADISSTGETSRPSRRARAAISYAEPNLRDKMRRPTKELFDAVAGEGKFAHRASATTRLDDHHSGPTSGRKPGSEPGSSTGNRGKTLAAGDPTSKAQQQALMSPLAQKDAFPETLPSSVVTERRKRPSAVGSSRESLAAMERSDSASREPSPVNITQPQAPAHTGGNRPKNSATERASSTHSASLPSQADIYDFTASSPSSSSKHSTPDPSSEPKPPAISSNPQAHAHSARQSRPARKSSMAAAAALRELLDEEEQDAKASNSNPPHKPSRPGAHGRGKRASMVAPKKSSMLDDDYSLEDAAADADTSGTAAASVSSGEGEVAAGGGRGGAGGRIARRRSMML